MQLSEIQPQLKKANIRLIAVGLEWLGVEDFIQGNYFKGELFIDVSACNLSARHSSMT